MGRPAQFSRDEAVKIAVDTFWSKGYDAASVSALSAAMSITRSSFYNCFKTREALFDDVLERYGKTAPDYFLASLDTDAPIVPAIRQALRNFCRDRAADPDARGCLVVNCLAQTDLASETVPQLIALMESKISRYEELLKIAVQRGEIDPLPSERTLAQAILTHIIGINIMCKIVRSEDALWRSTELFLEGVGLRG